MRIIACGNRNRSDDGAGLLVAERLRSFGIQVEVQSGEALDLIEAWRGADEVIVIDTVVTGARPGTLHIWDGAELQLPACSQPSSHGLGVAEAISLSRTLNYVPKRLQIFGIEGRNFNFGSTVSPQLLTTVEKLVDTIRAGIATETITA
ncbi:MAG TPA: hydrogenase maturation protease [Terriglobales bacterium]|nr:hydrogenase maturation protease [Terriglobales bacterium]